MKRAKQRREDLVPFKLLFLYQLFCCCIDSLLVEVSVFSAVRIVLFAQLNQDLLLESVPDCYAFHLSPGLSSLSKWRRNHALCL